MSQSQYDDSEVSCDAMILSLAAGSPTPAARQDTPAGTRRVRRVFSAAEKLRILQEAEHSTKRGGIEGILRREAIYSSHLAAWRKQLALRGPAGLECAKPGRKPKLDPRDHRIVELERRLQSLEQELAHVTGDPNHAARIMNLSTVS